MEGGVTIWNPDSKACLLQLFAQPVLLSFTASFQFYMSFRGKGDIMVKKLSHEH